MPPRIEKFETLNKYLRLGRSDWGTATQNRPEHFKLLGTCAGTEWWEGCKNGREEDVDVDEPEPSNERYARYDQTFLTTFQLINIVGFLFFFFICSIIYKYHSRKFSPSQKPALHHSNMSCLPCPSPKPPRYIAASYRVEYGLADGTIQYSPPTRQFRPGSLACSTTHVYVITSQTWSLPEKTKSSDGAEHTCGYMFSSLLFSLLFSLLENLILAAEDKMNRNRRQH